MRIDLLQIIIITFFKKNEKKVFMIDIGNISWFQ